MLKLMVQSMWQGDTLFVDPN